MKAIFETRYARIGETKGHYGQFKINSTTAAKEFCLTYLADWLDDKCDQEEFLVAILDTKLFCKRIVRVTRGTLDASLVHPREVFRPAIHDAASAILLIHNHPSGDPTPSPMDREVTDRLRKVGDLVGINVLDHIVVGNGSAVSILES